MPLSKCLRICIKSAITFKFAERYYFAHILKAPIHFAGELHSTSNKIAFMTDEQYMQLALKEAQKAFATGEIPIGAIVVMNGQVIARAHNQTELLNDTTAHAEILALTTAFNYLGSKYLPDATLYVSIEPCLMCSGALYWSKIGRVVYGAEDEKNGYKRCCGSNNPFHPKTELVSGILKDEAATLMKEFFKARR
jgi:tRNA(adenine34) deaminase